MKTVDTSRSSLSRALIACGILSSVWYAAINVYVPTQYPGYSLASLTVSELSAIGAPTRQLWVLLVLPYPLLFGAFGWGILKAAGACLPARMTRSDGPDRQRNRPLGIVGALIIAYCVFNFYWPPMHQRGLEPTLTDTLHIVWAFVTVLFMITMMGFGAAAFGIQFRIYTIASIALHIIFGILTGLEAPNIPLNGPTPWIGVWERVNIGIFMAWVIVLAIMALKRESVIGSNSKPTQMPEQQRADNSYAPLT